MTNSTWLIKIAVETSDDADYILEHLDRKNAVLSTELEELEC